MFWIKKITGKGSSTFNTLIRAESFSIKSINQKLYHVRYCDAKWKFPSFYFNHGQDQDVCDHDVREEWGIKNNKNESQLKLKCYSLPP